MIPDCSLWKCACSCDAFSFRIMQDHNEGSSLQNQALQTLQERLHEADATLKREQESYRQMQVRRERLNSLGAQAERVASVLHSTFFNLLPG